ncbi:MAG: hypothetical protein JW807_15525 [Spirochaetes bacterium]|nr:hypothetical protein [Spirochaetota bacterium]
MPKKPMKSKSSKQKKAASKKAVHKKPAAGKATPKKKSKAGKTSGRTKGLRDQMIKQIHAMALTLEEDSLKKLLQDAAILAHNERVLSDFIESKNKPRAEAPRVFADIEEGTDGTYFIVILKGYRHIFSLEEMRNLVKACHAAEGAPLEAGPRLFNWMERWRRDILHNSKIADNHDQALRALWEKIVNTYAPRG